MITLLSGLVALPPWGYVLVALALTHVTIVAVTVYLHRCQAHHAIDLHPLVSHFFRFWLWMTTGMTTKAWAAIHRKHHAKVETAADPHSPQIFGLKKVLWEGAELYRQEAGNLETLERYGHGTPDDWLERRLYTAHSVLGIALCLITLFILFGFAGIVIWAVQMAWIPFFAAGVINGVAHYFGYRNFGTPDTSTNIIPIGILIGGEELHNNHHAYASSAKFSCRWWEFDIGYGYIMFLSLFGLASVKKLAPVPVSCTTKQQLDEASVRDIISSKPHVLARYARRVMKPVYQEESQGNVNADSMRALKKGRRLIIESALPNADSPRIQKNIERLTTALRYSKKLQLAHDYRLALQNIWEQKTWENEALLRAMREWCERAEQSGIAVLQEFALWLKGYSIPPKTQLG